MTDTKVAKQKYRTRIAMSDAERDEYLSEQRVCRIATISISGPPHLSPLYFVWNGGQVWVCSLVRSARWSDIARDAHVSVLVDSGERYGELRGVEIAGTAAAVGEVPRMGEQHDLLEDIEAMMSAKYGEGLSPHDGKHAWLAITPSKIVSWDFRKLTTVGSS
jgi:general stress protein 26